MTSARIRPGLALAALACLSSAPALHAQETTPTPASVGPSVYSGGASSEPEHRGRSGGHAGADRGGGGANGGNGNGGNAGGGNGGDADDSDDSQSAYGMSVSTLDPGSGADSFDAMPLDSWLQTHAGAAYAGGGLGNIVAHYPSSSGSNVAGEVFAGARLRYAGVEASYDTLGYYQATVNNQPVQIGTDLFSASVLGFLPLGGNTDLYLRYGRTAWNVTVHSSSASPLPVMSGTDALIGAGMEFRHNELLIRVETKRFRDVFQSDSYNYTGLSVGGYFY